MKKQVCILPLRAGSKSIPHKNRLRLFGRPLFTWVLSEAIFSKLDEIIVFTDDKEIYEFVNKEYKWTQKVRAIKRSMESSTDTAGSEYAMKELAEKIDYSFDIYCLMQATSPLLHRDNINTVLNYMQKKKYDSVLTVVKNKRFFWDREGKSVNYDYLKRPRRQEFNGTMVENGAFYAIKKEQYLKKYNRLGGRIGLVEMRSNSLTEIDEPGDIVIIEALIKNHLRSLKGTLNRIKLLVLDVDGVLTDGSAFYSDKGEMIKKFSLRDGMGIELIRQSGVDVIVMTSEDSDIVRARASKLKINNCFVGVKDKFARLESILVQNKILRSQIAYIGDDINDIANICSAGLSFCPLDAEITIKLEADIVLSEKGGRRAVREAVNFILKYNERF